MNANPNANAETKPAGPARDPVLDGMIVRQSFREAIVSLAVWGLATGYSLFYCAKYGYGGDNAEPLRFVMGIPDWVFWGILVPWTACTLFSIGFSSFFMADHDWGDAAVADAEDAMWQDWENSGE